MINALKNIKKENDFFLSGLLKNGVRCLLQKGDRIEIIPNNMEYRNLLDYAKTSKANKILLASTNRYIIRENDIFGTSGGTKFYHPIDENVGLYVFASMSDGTINYPSSFIKKYVKIALLYEKMKIFPKIHAWVNVHLDLIIEKLHRDNLDDVKLNGCAFALITDRIFSPNYSFDPYNDFHMKFFRRVWKNKTLYPIILSKKDISLLFGKEFIKNNPNFRLDKFKNFRKRIRKIYLSNKDHFKLRNTVKGKIRKLDDKYGNVLYCPKNKRWYFVDFE